MKNRQWFSPSAPGKLFVAIVCLSIVLAFPLLVDNWLSAKYQHHTDLLRAHECVSEICAVDFDGDGILGRVFIDRSSSNAPHEYQLIVRENGKEFIRLPYWELDYNTRTHVATNNSYTSGKTHLLVYERKGRNAPIVSAVYGWNGSDMIQIPPSEVEKEVFNAMAARDQNGTFNNWILYRMIRMPTLVGYYLMVVLAISVVGKEYGG